MVTHHQLSLLKAKDVHFILDRRTVANMSRYLAGVVSHLDATNGWVNSEEYVRVRRGVDRSLAEMRTSQVSFVAQYRNEVIGDGTSSSESDSVVSAPDENHSADALAAVQEDLSSFLSLIYPERSSSTSTLLQADRFVLTTNFTPLVQSDSPPYTYPDSDTCQRSASSISTGSSTAYSDSPRGSSKGKERALPEYTRSPSPVGSDWSTSAEKDFPSRLPPLLGLMLFPDPLDSQEAGPSTHKRSRDESPDSLPSPPKKRRVSLELHGFYGCSSDCKDHDAVARRVKPFIGRPVPLHGLSPYELPSPRSSLSSAPSENSESSSRQASPVPSQDSFWSCVGSTSSPEIFEIPDLCQDTSGEYGCEPSLESTGPAEFVDTNGEISNGPWTHSWANGARPHPIHTGALTVTAVPSASDYRHTARKARRCFAGLLESVKDLFSRR